MSLNYGIFNSVENEGAYDRDLEAKFFNRLIAAICRNFIAPGSFKVTAAGGLNLSVAKGEGFLNGVFFYDDSASTLTCTSATGTRQDLVVARINSAARTISIEIKTGASTAADNELAIANVTVVGSAVTAVSQKKYTHFYQHIPAITYGTAEPSGGEDGDIYIKRRTS